VAHLVSVTGIAGIGKSRVAWEFFKYFSGLPQVTYWHRGRCLSYGEGVTYWALADMVRMRCRIAEDEQPSSALQKLQAVVAEHIVEEDERRFVEPRVAHLLGLEEGQRYERDDLFSAWRIFFERLAEVNPVVMVFEDMQWADDSLLDFIDYLLEHSRSFPLFVCALARPELQELRPMWGAGRRNFSSIYLDPLPQAAMEELLTGLVPGLPDELRTQILQRAEGIPLYAVETVRMMLDRGALAQEGAVYRPTGPIAALEVPETLHALIAARLDGLAADERRLLQDASVLGKTFTKRSLGALANLTESDLEPLLGSLVRKELLGIQADPRSPEYGQYSFLQDLVRHVGYETLSRHERKARHLAAAAHLESAFPDEEEIVEVLASHYLDAYGAAPHADDAGAIKVKARAMLTRAGDRAASLAAAREAQRYFEQATELAEDGVTRAELEDRAGRMAWRRGRGEEARALLERAHSTFEEAGLAHPAARVSARLAEIDFREGHAAEGIARLEQALQALSTEEPDEDVAGLAASLGRYLVLAGRLEEATPHIENALSLAEGLDLPEVLTQALVSKSIVLIRQNRLEEARILLEAALAKAEAEGLTQAAARASNNLAVLFESRDRYAEASVAVDRGVAFARRIGDRPWEVQMLAGVLSTLVLLGRWNEALELAADVAAAGLVGVMNEAQLLHLVEVDCWRGQVEQARARLDGHPAAAPTGDPQTRSMYTLHEAMVLRTAGDARAGLEVIDRELTAVVDELGISFVTTKLMLVEALEGAFEAGDRPKLEQLLATIEELRPGQRPPMLAAHAARFRAKLASDPAEAEAGFQRAEQMFHEYELPFWLAVTQLEHAEWLVGEGRPSDAEPMLAEAREAFARLEAKPWLDRVEAVVRARAEVPA
jgi:tetratricopeptide (TPR) repeat protein